MQSTLLWRTAEEINSAMAKVYANMALATVVSMVVAYLVGTTPQLAELFLTGITKWIVLFLPLAFVFIVPRVIENSTKQVAQLMLVLFAATMGLSFASIFLVYKMGSIATAFMGAAVLFGILSIWGYFTKKDLSGWGSYLMAGVIAIIIVSVINIFIGSTALQMAVSAIAVVVFLALTAYDTQTIREMVSQHDSTGNPEVLGALTLYLDFINIFLSLLNLTGDRN